MLECLSSIFAALVFIQDPAGEREWFITWWEDLGLNLSHVIIIIFFYFTAESFKETHFKTLNVVKVLLKLATVGPSGLSIIGVL